MLKEKLYLAKVFQNGMSQAIRLPKALRVETKEVYVKRSNDGKNLILIPKKSSLREFFESSKRCSEDFLNDRKQEKPQERNLF